MAIVVMSLQSILGVVIQVTIIDNYQQFTAPKVLAKHGGGSAGGGGCGGSGGGGDDCGGDDIGGKMNTFLFPPSALSAF